MSAARAELESLLRARKLDVTLTTTATWRKEDDERLAPTGWATLDTSLGGRDRARRSRRARGDARPIRSCLGRGRRRGSRPAALDPRHGERRTCAESHEPRAAGRGIRGRRVRSRGYRAHGAAAVSAYDL